MTNATLPIAERLYEMERHDDTIVVTPFGDLRELDFDHIEAAAAKTLELLSGSGAKNLVLDFRNTDYYGSSALGLFVKLWKRIKKHGGHMAFCNLSPHEKEILEITHLDHFWSVYPTRNEALAALSR
jgi:anti-anti-sigma factor